MEENGGETKYGKVEENRRWRIRRNGRRDKENEKGEEKKITNREEPSEKGKTFVTLSCRTIGRKNNIINLLTFQYCINLSVGIHRAH